jgi:hypothetical protein
MDPFAVASILPYRGYAAADRSERPMQQTGKNRGFFHGLRSDVGDKAFLVQHFSGSCLNHFRELSSALEIGVPTNR